MEAITGAIPTMSDELKACWSAIGSLEKDRTDLIRELNAVRADAVLMQKAIERSGWVRDSRGDGVWYHPYKPGSMSLTDFEKWMSDLLEDRAFAQQLADSEYARGVSAGKKEALAYTAAERETYGKWATQGELFLEQKAEIEALRAKLDICKRYAEGEGSDGDCADLANDYGGHGYEEDPTCRAVAKMQQAYEKAFRLLPPSGQLDLTVFWNT